MQGIESSEQVAPSPMVNQIKGGVLMYQGLLGGALTGAAAVVLPNTGDNRALAVTAVVSILVGATIIVTSAARLVAKRVHKA